MCFILPSRLQTENDEQYLNTIPGWRLHKKFQSSLETELLPNTPSQ